MLLDHDGLSDLGQEESDYIDTEVSALTTHDIYKRLRHHRCAQDIDYFQIGQAWQLNCFQPEVDERLFHQVRTALTVHYIAALASGGVKLLRTAQQTNDLNDSEPGVV